MRRRFLKIYQMFPYFAPYWAPKAASSFTWINVKSFFEHVSSFPYISLCTSLNPWVRIIHDPREFIWTNVNPLSQQMIDTKYQCILTSGSWEEYVWRFINVFLILSLIGPRKGPALLFEHIGVPILQACFLPSLVAVGLVVLEKSIKGKVKGRRRRRRQADCDSNNSSERLRWAKKVQMFSYYTFSSSEIIYPCTWLSSQFPKYCDF